VFDHIRSGRPRLDRLKILQNHKKVLTFDKFVLIFIANLSKKISIQIESSIE